MVAAAGEVRRGSLSGAFMRPPIMNNESWRKIYEMPGMPNE
jgi:hypothetical protein